MVSLSDLTNIVEMLPILSLTNVQGVYFKINPWICSKLIFWINCNKILKVLYIFFTDRLTVNTLVDVKIDYLMKNPIILILYHLTLMIHT